jgi:L-iditol 2-dehydrogenase
MRETFVRVAMYYNNRDVRLEEMPTPSPGPGEVLLRIMASGICGSDVLEWYRIRTAPRVLGHEVGGVIAEVGPGAGSRPPDAGGWQAGDRVFVTHHVPCNTCHYCLAGHHTACETLHRTNFDPGGFAEYVRIPALNVERGMLRLPEEVSFEEATFIEPLACVLRGQRLARLEPGQTVVVLGSGISGALHIKLAAALGAGRILATDVSDYRLGRAQEFGADMALHAQEDVVARLRQVTGGRLADLVIVCAGALSASRQALSLVDRGGKVLYFAVPEPGVELPLPIADLWRNEVTLLTSYGGAPADLAQALEVIRSRRVTVADMITHRLPLAETGRGFQLVASAGESLKVIIEPQR